MLCRKERSLGVDRDGGFDLSEGRRGDSDAFRALCGEVFPLGAGEGLLVGLDLLSITSLGCMRCELVESTHAVTNTPGPTVRHARTYMQATRTHNFDKLDQLRT